MISFRPVDFTIPYTLYPSALPHEWAWALFAGAISGSLLVTAAVSRHRSRCFVVFTLLGSIPAFLVGSVAISMVIMFFIHDI